MRVVALVGDFRKRHPVGRRVPEESDMESDRFETSQVSCRSAGAVLTEDEDRAIFRTLGRYRERMSV